MHTYKHMQMHMHINNVLLTLANDQLSSSLHSEWQKKILYMIYCHFLLVILAILLEQTTYLYQEWIINAFPCTLLLPTDLRQQIKKLSTFANKKLFFHLVVKLSISLLVNCLLHLHLHLLFPISSSSPILITCLQLANKPPPPLRPLNNDDEEIIMINWWVFEKASSEKFFGGNFIRRNERQLIKELLLSCEESIIKRWAASN